ATNPPGKPAPCSAVALTAAGHWPELPYDPLVRDVGDRVSVVRFACADGWALATDRHRVAVYEQHGPVLNQPVGRRWLRVGLGTPRQLGAAVDFALPRSLLRRLGHEIGINVAAASRQPTYPNEPSLTMWERAPIRVPFGPGDTYVAPDLSR